MSDERTIREAIKRIAGAGSGSIVYTVEITDVTDTDCTVKLGELELTKVRYFSQANEAGNILLKPKAGSMATMICDPDLRDCEIVKADKVTLIKWEENGLVIEIDSEAKKCDIKNDQVSLKDLFQSVADIVKQLTVSTPSGPSGTPLPPTIQQVTQFETDFKSLLK
jgi:hypothetical protein